MSLSRFAKRRDANEKDVVAALERAGALVLRLDVPCDLLVGLRGVWRLVEVKDGSKPKSEPSNEELREAAYKRELGAG